jgi:hypothetical protein
VPVTVGEAVAVGDGVGVSASGVAVAVAVAIAVSVGVDVAVCVGVGVDVGVSVDVSVNVAVGVSSTALTGAAAVRQARRAIAPSAAFSLTQPPRPSRGSRAAEKATSCRPGRADNLVQAVRSVSIVVSLCMRATELRSLPSYT